MRRWGGGIWFPLLDGLSVCVHRSVRYWMMRFPDNRVTSSSWAKNGNVCVCVRAQVRGEASRQKQASSQVPEVE